MNKEKKKILYTKSYLQYSLGGMMYTPAVNLKISETILTNKYAGLRAICICLEDSINDDSLEYAEEQLISTLKSIQTKVDKNEKKHSDLPLIFVRIRTPEHLDSLIRKIMQFDIFYGFVLPKVDSTNIMPYIDTVKYVNSCSDRVIYCMPTLESERLIRLDTRVSELCLLRNSLDEIANFVLNIRVGGNDFCRHFGIRRNVTQTIYDISPVRNILSDIVTTFSDNYVISAPVWEYFDNKCDNLWKIGLQKEIEQDKLNGFIGKTAIHPSQLPIINESMKVNLEDYKDAIQLLNWDEKHFGVGKSVSGGRMNEIKTHERWARKIIMLADIFGIHAQDL